MSCKYHLASVLLLQLTFFFLMVSALSFLLTDGAFDKALEWTTLTAAQRSTVKSQYAAAGVKLIVSLFGSTDAPTTNGADPVATANTMAAWVKEFDLDGADVDYEVSKICSIGDDNSMEFPNRSCCRTSMLSMPEMGQVKHGSRVSLRNSVPSFHKALSSSLTLVRVSFVPRDSWSI